MMIGDPCTAAEVMQGRRRGLGWGCSRDGGGGGGGGGAKGRAAGGVRRRRKKWL